MKKVQDEDLRPFYTYGLTLLQLMSLLALLGIVLTVISYHFFS